MATISTTGSNPLSDFGKMIGVDSVKRHSKEDIQHAQSVLADEMARLYPDGAINPGRKLATWTDPNLRHIVKHGEIMDANGKYTPVSDETRAAAQKILDSGGGSVINPNGDPWVSEDDLRNSISKGLPNNEKFSDIAKRLEV